MASFSWAVEKLLLLTYLPTKCFHHPLTKVGEKNLVKMTADPNATKSWDKRSFQRAPASFYLLGIFIQLHMKKILISACVCNNFFFSWWAFRKPKQGN